MEYIMAILFMLSSIGYFSWMRRTFRLSFSSSVFFSTCAAIVLMFIFGLLRIMTLGAWVIFAGGFVPALLDVFSVEKRRFRNDWFARIKAHYWRTEYCLWCVVIGYALIIFLDYGLLGKTDIWMAWYDQFYYMALNGHWIDSGYKNYASGYSMIVNSFSYYIAAVFDNFGIQIYTFSYFAACVGLIAPVFSLVNWRKVFCVETIALLLLLCNYKMTHSFGMHAFWVTVFAFLWLRKLINSENRSGVLKNTVPVFVGVFLGFLLINYPWCFLSYGIDSTLGAAFFGIVCCWIAEFCFTARLKGRALFFVLPLTVITLLKPTGVIFSSFAALAVALHLCWTAISCRKKKRKSADGARWYRRPWVCCLSAAVILLLPVAVRQSWVFYARSSNLRLQHSVKAGKVIHNMTRQLQNGLSVGDKNHWRKQMWGGFMLYGLGSFSGFLYLTKTPVEQKLAKWIAGVFYRNGWDVSNSLLRDGNIPANRSFVFSILAVQILLCLLMILCMKDHKSVAVYAFVWSVFVWGVVFILQYYITPMFTTVPGISRYFWPGMLPLWSVVTLLLIWLIKRNFPAGVVFAAIFLYIFTPLFFTKYPADTVSLFKNNTLGWIMLSHKNAGNFSRAFFSEPYTASCVNDFLHYRLGFPHEKIHFPTKVICKPGEKVLFAACDNISGLLPAFFKQHAFSPGFYLLSNDDGKKITVKKLYDRNEEAVALLNRGYSLKSPECWSRPPVVERDINGGFSSGATLDDSKWLLKSDGKRNCPDHYSLKRRFWGKRKLVLKTTKHSSLENWYYQYVFVEDKLKLTWTMDSPVKPGVFVNLRKKNGARYKHIKSVLMKTAVIKTADGKYRFEGTLDLAEHKGADFDHYMLSIVFPACPEGLSISDIKMMQTVSGKLYFDPADTVKKN